MAPKSTEKTVINRDRRIASVLVEHHPEVLHRLWTEALPGEAEGSEGGSAQFERVLYLLVQAFQYGRWGSYYCSYEPMEGVRWLTRVAGAVTPHLLMEEDASALVGHLMQVVGEMSMVVARTMAEAHVEELRELLEVKTGFIRLTTHELRRPLGLARGHLALLQEGTYGELPEMMMHPLQQIASSSSEMAGLLDGLAEIARLEDRAEVLTPGPCRIGVLLQDAVRTVEPEARMKQVYIQHLPPQQDLQIMADAEKLRIAVLNLLTNAVKYAPSESVVRVETRQRQDEVAIAVADQGPGIDPSEGERVFEKHFRSGTLRDDLPGLGLGLYIVRQIVELHGGRVTLDSIPGAGSTFAIHLPA